MSDPFFIIARHQEVAPIPLEAIARDLGIDLIVRRLGQDNPGYLTRDLGSRSGFSIHINSIQPSCSQRFALAKEIAHYALHRDLLEQGVAEDTVAIRENSHFFDAQAKKLAVDILLPVKLVEKHRKETGLEVDALAELFGVTATLMGRRLVSVEV